MVGSACERNYWKFVSGQGIDHFQSRPSLSHGSSLWHVRLLLSLMYAAHISCALSQTPCSVACVCLSLCVRVCVCVCVDRLQCPGEEMASDLVFADTTLSTSLMWNTVHNKTSTHDFMASDVIITSSFFRRGSPPGRCSSGRHSG